MTSRCSLPSVPQSGGPLVLELPLDKIRRPLMRTRANDPQKVKELMESIREIGLQVPIDVLEVDGEYYGFSGCHRYEAHQRLGLPTIRCKVRRGTKETLSRALSKEKDGTWTQNDRLKPQDDTTKRCSLRLIKVFLHAAGSLGQELM
ncbi:Sulfiredoxin, chloroplastic/mitochondrial [Sesamum angolense]|uniref:sulfiredoxin n=1 Tax=Sesamum angolense TaxID=2727404 RepID=A0AAE1WTT6_9LAMI|nr:Sulfiredoxin, chloroplastic/mitochondrial [Sesamum angolense]